jgi:hypothetical protein
MRHRRRVQPSGCAPSASMRGRRGGKEASWANGSVGDERMGFEDRDRANKFDSMVRRERSDGRRTVTCGIAACA